MLSCLVQREPLLCPSIVDVHVEFYVQRGTNDECSWRFETSIAFFAEFMHHVYQI